MRSTRALFAQRQPLIKFLGKRHTPKAEEIDHAPHAHPASPSHELPESFASYRGRAPLGGQQQQQQNSSSQSTSSSRQGAPSGSAAAQTSKPYGAIGGHSGKQLGSVQPKQGEFWDRNELPRRFHRTQWTEAEMEGLESGGATYYTIEGVTAEVLQYVKDLHAGVLQDPSCPPTSTDSEQLWLYQRWSEPSTTMYWHGSVPQGEMARLKQLMSESDE
ncbi:hypothetical protein B0A55_00582 [Friedmanniomyces simplex]|uniref:Uncharacterized protein n=1 Tax=Friedmanniomyces simplex TaxID=329884 RepID=A0A4U0Y058_9PEZI|nr:hypothetical protein B0A55_00582 [Friedmanniomyces simplex]